MAMVASCCGLCGKLASGREAVDVDVCLRTQFAGFGVRTTQGSVRGCTRMMCWDRQFCTILDGQHLLPVVVILGFRYISRWWKEENLRGGLHLACRGHWGRLMHGTSQETQVAKSTA